MANKTDIDYTYSTIDEIFRLSIGEMGDFSGAKYDGDFSLSLAQAQTQKHQFVFDNLNIGSGDRVLDLGCGWGPFLAFAKLHGVDGLGLTISEGQHRACLKNGLDVHLKDCRTVKRSDFGTFDGLVSIGAFEHFASIKDHCEGKQRMVYRDFFKNCYDLVGRGDRFYLQTMVFGKNMIPLDQIDIHAPKESDAYIMALMVEQFPGSWLPYGREMVEEATSPYFKLVSADNGHLDYIETIDQWRKGFRKFNIKKYWLYLSLLPQYFTNSDFRHRLAVFQISPNKVCFERGLMDHFRFVFEKV